jgi:hypothetical protein
VSTETCPPGIDLSHGHPRERLEFLEHPLHSGVLVIRLELAESLNEVPLEPRGSPRIRDHGPWVCAMTC